jgi:hypothetical protein
MLAQAQAITKTGECGTGLRDPARDCDARRPAASDFLVPLDINQAAGGVPMSRSESDLTVQ